MGIEVVQHDVDFVLHLTLPFMFIHFCLELTVVRKLAWCRDLLDHVVSRVPYPTLETSGIGANVHMIYKGEGDAPLPLCERDFEDLCP
jgi:hypothetical protein